MNSWSEPMVNSSNQFFFLLKRSGFLFSFGLKHLFFYSLIRIFVPNFFQTKINHQIIVS